MAPTKASKRASATAAAAPPSPKKSRVDPKFSGILETLEGSEDLNEQCRKMLILMATPSLSKAKCERHDIQNLGVTMIEEALQAHYGKLTAQVEQAHKELSDLEASRSTIAERVEAAKALLSEKQAAKESTCTAHEAAQTAVESADSTSKAALKQQEKVEEAHASLEKERSAIEEVYKEYFIAPMENNEGPRYNFLKPFLGKLSLEEALMQAAPSSCVKTKDQRGGFDNLVVTELGKAFTEKIKTLQKSIADGSSTITELKAATAAAEKALEEKTVAAKAATEAFESAKAEVVQVETQLAAATEEFTSFEPSVQASTKNHQLHEAARQEFENGTLKSFGELRDAETPLGVVTEAATAGA